MTQPETARVERGPITEVPHFALGTDAEKWKAQRDALLEALKLSRAQWIHSVNSDHCLAAIKAAEENT